MKYISFPSKSMRRKKKPEDFGSKYTTKCPFPKIEWYSHTIRKDAAERESLSGLKTIHQGWLFIRRRRRKEESSLLFRHLSKKLSSKP